MNQYDQLFKIPFDYKHFYNDLYKPEYKTYLYPGEDGEKQFKDELERFKQHEDYVLFDNIVIDFETCDCEYSCSHGRWPYRIKLKNNSNTNIEFEENGVFIDNEYGFIKFNNIKEISIGDFCQACELLKVKLDFTENAKKIMRFKFV